MPGGAQDVGIGIVLFGIALWFRAKCNTVSRFSPADETVYRTISIELLKPGAWKRLPGWTRGFLEDVGKFPVPPTRLFWCWITARLAARRSDDGDGRTVSFRGLTWVSTVFGAAAVPVAYALARGGGDSGLLAAGLVLFAPIGLGMGRRAVHDAPVATVLLAAFGAASTGHGIVLGVLFLLLLVMKEVSVIAAPGLLLSYLLSGRAPLLELGTHISVGAVALGSALLVYGALISGGLNLGFRDFLRILRILVPTDDYTKQFERGPVHTYATQFFLLSPVAAILLVRGLSLSPLAMGLALHVALLSVATKKNYRTFTGPDLLLRVLAVHGLRESSVVACFAVGVCMLVDVAIFRRVFVQEETYDPVFYNVSRALRMVP